MDDMATKSEIGMRRRVAVFVSGGGTNLQALMDADMSSADIALVVSNRADAFAVVRAERAGIRAVTIAEKGAAFEEKALAVLSDAKIDVIVLAGFLAILSPAFLRHYEDRVINVHPSLIPAFCGKGYYGLRVHEAALARGVKITGATVHLVNEIPDGGRILLQKAVQVLPEDTPETLQKRVMEEAEWVLLPQAVETCCKTLR